MADMDHRGLIGRTVVSEILAWIYLVIAMIDVAMTVESKSARLLGIMVETMCQGKFEMSVPRCHPLAAETAGKTQELVLQPVHVVGAMKPLQRHGRHGKCSSLHLDHGHRIPTMED
jgi:hypothetical protein